VTPLHDIGHARGRAAALLVGLAALGAAPPVSARTGSCSPVRVASSTSDLPAAWRDALDGLVQATADAGMPWSCPGGSVELVLDASGSGAVMTIYDAKGRAVSRRVASPDDLIPTGQALLASPLDERPPAVSPPLPVPPPEPGHPKAAGDPPGPKEPRIQVQALIGTRVSGPLPTGWVSGQLRGVVPFGPWSVGLWARYDLPFTTPREAPKGLEMSEVCVGFAMRRGFVAGPLELHVTLDPSIAIVVAEAGSEDDPKHPEGTSAAFRLGAGLGGTFRIGSIFRGVVALDGEFAPAGVKSPLLIARVIRAPVYTAGLLLGVEAVIR
jgi:hypothetical protein